MSASQEWRYCCTVCRTSGTGRRGSSACISNVDVLALDTSSLGWAMPFFDFFFFADMVAVCAAGRGQAAGLRKQKSSAQSLTRADLRISAAAATAIAR